MITAQNILKHELIGLYACVVSSTNFFDEGVEGVIVDETRNTLVLNTDKGLKRLEKHGRSFCVRLCDSVKASSLVKIDGDALVNRSKKKR